MVKVWSEDDPKAGLMARKRAAIVDAALRAFLDSGYAESSVNYIAAQAGVSIKTLYRHFENKDDLFKAVIQAACSKSDPEAGGSSTQEPAWLSKPPPTALALAGRHYLQHALSDEQIALYRVVVRDAHRFPEIGHQYEEEVIGRQDALFIDYLDRWLPSTGWKVANKRAAARVFFALLRADLFDDVLHGGKKPSSEAIAEGARSAARRMLALLESGRL